MKKISIKRWIIVTMMFGVFANIAHPVTPRFIKGLGLGDSMFGWAFAGMAFTNFMFSPLWAKICSKIGAAKVTAITLFFYGVSQLMFGYSTTAFQIMFARLFGGFFIGGLYVAQLVYIIDNSEGEEKSKAIMTNATMQIVFGTLGFLIGGLIGDKSIKAAFLFQFLGLMLASLYVVLFIGENKKEDPVEMTLQSVNPFNSLRTEEVKTNKYLKNILIVSILASTATVLYDQTFNYYMADFFNFPPSINGFVKAITGVLAFISNSTLAIYIIKKKDLTKSLAYLYTIVGLLIIALISIKIPLVFLGINIIYFVIHSAYIPFIQKIVTDSATNQNEVVGTMNSLKSLGMILGAIIAGQTYAISKQLPFILASAIYFISAIIIVLNQRKTKEI